MIINDSVKISFVVKAVKAMFKRLFVALLATYSRPSGCELWFYKAGPSN